jgi:drug/metabolite transporter (DMT)-like permease
VDNAFLLVAVLLLTASQLLQKLAARRLGPVTSFADGLRAVLSRELIGAVICITLGTAFWLVALYRMDVGRAFPFLSLSSVIVVAMSRLLLKEAVPFHRWVGVGLICAGVALVARS